MIFLLVTPYICKRAETKRFHNHQTRDKATIRFGELGMEIHTSLAARNYVRQGFQFSQKIKIKNQRDRDIERERERERERKGNGVRVG